MNAHLTVLPSGLRIATCEMPHVDTAALGIWAGVGGRHEPEQLNGISHFIEHMLFKGTARRSARRIMEEVESVGGDMNAYTAEERTCYYAAASAEHFTKICDVVTDLYLNPKFARTDIERERGVIGEEILMYRDEPSAHVQEMLNQMFWRGHALGRPLTGTLETIQSFQRDDLLAYRATHYHAASTVVSAAGRIRHDDVLRALEGTLERLPPGTSIKASRAPKPSSARIVAEQRDTQQTQLAIGLPATSHHDPRRYALQILNVIVGGSASSRLFQELREKRGLCYSVSTHPSCFHDAGMLNISLGLEHKNIARCLRLVRKSFDDLRARPVRPSELRRAKEYVVGTSRMSLERTSNQNMRLGSSVLVYGRIIDPEEIHSHLRAVTAEQVQSAARDFLNLARSTAAVIGPAPDAAMMKEILHS